VTDGRAPGVKDNGTHRSVPPSPHRDVRVIVAAGIGGMIGTLARATVEATFPPGSGFPTTTLVVNLAGAALLVWLVVRLSERLPPSTYVRPMLGTGFCGGLTTFSTMQVEAVKLLDHGHDVAGVGYLVTSCAGGLIATAYVLRAARRARWLVR
jgi:fluoride exporter